MAELDLDYLMALAGEIGKRIEAGDLPRRDGNGMYVMDAAAADVAAKVAGDD